MGIKKGKLQSSIEIAPSLERIGFSEFTTKLVLDIFEALVKTNTNQINAFIGLTKNLQQDLSTFINNTKDEISDLEIFEFLEKMLITEEKIQKMRVEENNGKAISEIGLEEGDVTAINKGMSTNSGTIALTSTLGVLIDSISKRIAESKYSILKQMTALGMLRTVVNSGKIKTKLEFETVDLSTELARETKTQRDQSNFKGRLGGDWNGLIGNGLLGVSGGIGGGFSKIVVKTANKKNYDKNSTNLDLFGEVEINFSTDYMPLADIQNIE